MEDAFQSDRGNHREFAQGPRSRRVNAMAELTEENMGTAPLSPQDKRPMGIPFWLQKDPTTTPDGAFNGGNPSGFPAGCAGLDSNLYPAYATGRSVIAV